MFCSTVFRSIISCGLGAALVCGCQSQTPLDSHQQTLAQVLAAQPDSVRSRYRARHPQQTLNFFGIKPGMKVAEALPGGGWYTSILAPYLGADGELIALNYRDDMWPKFGFLTQDFIDQRIASTALYPEQVAKYAPTNTPRAAGYTFGTIPDNLSGTLDAVLFIRALHNLARFNDEGYLDQALAESRRILKPGGKLGVVQHASAENNLKGDTGYLNRDELVEKIESAGFTLIDESDINANPKDRPARDEIVWRLPPSYYTSQDKPELREQYQAIGESNRMTLLFKKN